MTYMFSPNERLRSFNNPACWLYIVNYDNTAKYYQTIYPYVHGNPIKELYIYPEYKDDGWEVALVYGSDVSDSIRFNIGGASAFTEQCKISNDSLRISPITLTTATTYTKGDVIGYVVKEPNWVMGEESSDYNSNKFTALTEKAYELGESPQIAAMLNISSEEGNSELTAASQKLGTEALSIGTEALSISSVLLIKDKLSAEDLGNLRNSSNMFNQDSSGVYRGKYLQYTTGRLLDHTNYNTSYKIILRAGGEYTIDPVRSYRLEDLGGNLIDAGEYNPPSSHLIESSEIDRVLQFSYNSTAKLIVVCAGEQIIPEKYYIADTVDIEDCSFTVPSKNLFNIDSEDNLIGRYLNPSGTSINEAYNTSHYIPVHPLTYYTSNSSTRFCGFYDISHNIIGELTTEMINMSPESAAYVRYTFYVADWSIGKIQVEEGTHSTTFEKFGNVIDSSVLPSEFLQGSDEVLLWLPDDIYIATGRTIELYNNQVMWCGNTGNYHFLWSGIGKNLKRKWSCYGDETLEGTISTLTCEVYNNDMELVLSTTTQVHFVADNIPQNTVICPIGDSLTNSKPWLEEVISLSDGKIIFNGTRGTIIGDSRTHEGRSGATASWYIANSTYTFDSNGMTGNDGRDQSLNPFWNPTTEEFDFAYYKSNYNQNPDAIQIYLGTNGASLTTTTNVNAIKGIVDRIRNTDITIPIFIVNTLFRGNQDGIGNGGATDGYTNNPAWKLEEDRKVFNLQVDLTNRLRDYENLYFIPISVTHDSENNFKNGTTTTVNPRCEITEDYVVEATHPQVCGYHQMADIIYSTYCGVLN